MSSVIDNSSVDPNDLLAKLTVATRTVGAAVIHEINLRGRGVGGHACMALLPFINAKGIRQTELAARVGVSKQGVGKLIRWLVDQGYIERVPDGDDGRAHVLLYTAKGRSARQAHLDAKRQVWRAGEWLLGAEDLAKLIKCLDDLTKQMDRAIKQTGGGKPIRRKEIDPVFSLLFKNGRE